MPTPHGSPGYSILLIFCSLNDYHIIPGYYDIYYLILLHLARIWVTKELLGTTRTSSCYPLFTRILSPPPKKKKERKKESVNLIVDSGYVQLLNAGCWKYGLPNGWDVTAEAAAAGPAP